MLREHNGLVSKEGESSGKLGGGGGGGGGGGIIRGEFYRRVLRVFSVISEPCWLS